MGLIINTKYLFIISILPLLLGEEHYSHPRCEFEKTEDCLTKISVYKIGNRSFEVFQLSSENVKDNILYCDWIEDRLVCSCSIFKCSSPDDETFHAFKSSTDKCLNVTNLQFSYGKINGIQCTPNEYLNLSTNGGAGSEDRSNAFPSGEISTSPTIVTKGHEDPSPPQSDTNKVWLPVIVTVAILIVAAAIVYVLWTCLRGRGNANKKFNNQENDPAHKTTEYTSVDKTDDDNV